MCVPPQAYISGPVCGVGEMSVEEGEVNVRLPPQAYISGPRYTLLNCLPIWGRANFSFPHVNLLQLSPFSTPLLLLFKTMSLASIKVCSCSTYIIYVQNLGPKSRYILFTQVEKNFFGFLLRCISARQWVTATIPIFIYFHKNEHIFFPAHFCEKFNHCTVLQLQE